MAARFTVGHAERKQVFLRTVQKTQAIAGEEVHLGPSIDMVPKVAADGSGINLSINARIN